MMNPRAGVHAHKRQNWYTRHREQPLGPGTTVTILRAVYNLVRLALDQRLSNAAFQAVAHHIDAMLRTVGIFGHPKTLRVCERVLGAESAEAVEFHVCPNCWWRYERLSKSEYKAHQSDVCPQCGLFRFIVGVGGSVRARRRCWDIGCKRGLRYLWSQDGFAEAVMRAKPDFTDSESFWGVPYGRMLDALCNNVFSKPPDGVVPSIYVVGAMVSLPVVACFTSCYCSRWVAWPHCTASSLLRVLGVFAPCGLMFVNADNLSAARPVLQAQMVVRSSQSSSGVASSLA
jgi:hypothetical protein